MRIGWDVVRGVKNERELSKDDARMVRRWSKSRNYFSKVLFNVLQLKRGVDKRTRRPLSFVLPGCLPAMLERLQRAGQHVVNPNKNCSIRRSWRQKDTDK